MRKSARNIIKNNLGRRVRELRHYSKMSQADLADEAETRRALISEIERGEANPTLDSIISIAMALGVDLADLFDPRR
jgi:transcriptional regulator with XRE-family HTH domain